MPSSLHLNPFVEGPTEGSQTQTTPTQFTQQLLANGVPSLEASDAKEGYSALRVEHTWISMEVNVYEQQLVMDYRLRFEREINPLVDRLRKLKDEQEFLTREMRATQDRNMLLQARLVKHGVDIPSVVLPPDYY
ncbi:hypothetical protein HWV62_3266 [Athelia sp. TMB]|nr:hypothetical protein HWV62_3266 [Athelia sp. TMB]